MKQSHKKKKRGCVCVCVWFPALPVSPPRPAGAAPE